MSGDGRSWLRTYSRPQPKVDIVTKDNLVSMPPLHMPVGWSNFDWPADWVYHDSLGNTWSISAYDLMLSWPQILIVTIELPDGTLTSYMRGWDTAYNFALEPGTNTWIWATEEFDLFVECNPRTIETADCWDGSWIVARTCSDQYQWVLSGQACPEQPAQDWTPLLLVGGAVALVVAVTMFGKKK